MSLQALAEDEHIRQRNKNLVTLMVGDTAERTDKAKERRAKLLARIHARQQPKKSTFYAYTEEQLKALSTPTEAQGESSPVSVSATAVVRCCGAYL